MMFVEKTSPCQEYLIRTFLSHLVSYAGLPKSWYSLRHAMGHRLQVGLEIKPSWLNLQYVALFYDESIVNFPHKLIIHSIKLSFDQKWSCTPQKEYNLPAKHLVQIYMWYMQVCLWGLLHQDSDNNRRQPGNCVRSCHRSCGCHGEEVIMLS